MLRRPPLLLRLYSCTTVGGSARSAYDVLLQDALQSDQSTCSNGVLFKLHFNLAPLIVDIIVCNVVLKL